MSRPEDTSGEQEEGLDEGDRSFLHFLALLSLGRRRDQTDSEKSMPQDCSAQFETHRPTLPEMTVQRTEHGDNWYPLSGGERRAVIITNSTFDDSTRLAARGSAAALDTRNMFAALRSLGFSVRVYVDLDVEQMSRVADAAASECGSAAAAGETTDVFVMVLSSHGDRTHDNEDVLFGRDGHGVRVRELMERFHNERCPALAGKPKLFFVQACRGRAGNRRVPVVRDAPHGAAAADSRGVPRGADMLLAQSTVPGYSSFRRAGEGSWFLSCLTRRLLEPAVSRDVHTTLVLAANDMITHYETRDQHVQAPQLTSSLRRLLHLNSPAPRPQ